MRIVVINHITLDGVMQGPGDAKEDTRDGFSHGGWAAPRNDPAMIKGIGERMAEPHSGMLLGRRSYESMLSAWNAKGGPYKDALNNIKKYVVAHSSATELRWPNSTLVHGDVPARIADLRGQPGGNLVIMGSGELIRTLMPHGLIDEFYLMIHPIVLGTGMRLFDSVTSPIELELIESSRTPSGVILGTFKPSLTRAEIKSQ